MFAYLVVVGLLLLGYYWIRQRGFVASFLVTIVSYITRKTGGPASVSVMSSGTAVCLSYSRLGQPYRVYLPYSRRHMSRMSGVKVLLLLDDGVEIDITQQPGIPYIASAREMGGVGIIARFPAQSESREVKYGGDDQPGFLE